MVAGTVNMSVAWWLLHSIEGICHQDPDSSSPWTCPNDHVFFDAPVIWGLVSPIRIFGTQGNYPAQLFLPTWAGGPRGGVGVPQGVPGEVMDPADQPARAAGSHGESSAGVSSELQRLDICCSTSLCIGIGRSGGRGITTFCRRSWMLGWRSWRWCSTSRRG